MDDQIHAHLERLTTPGRREGVVDDEQQVVSLGHFRHGLNVANLQHGVGQRFDVEDFGVLLDGGLVGGSVAHVRHRGLDAEAREFLS